MMELIPVDICAKGMIIAAEKHKKGSERQDTIPLYNAAALCNFDLETASSITTHAKDVYFDKAIGLPTLVIAKCKYSAYILSIFLHIIPALVIDTCYSLMGRKKIVMKLQRVLKFSEDSLSHFILNEFTFENSKFQALGHNLHEDDKKDFNLVPQVPLMKYLVKSLIVSKETVCGETAECAARAKDKIFFYKALGWVIKVTSIYITYKVFSFLLQFW